MAKRGPKKLDRQTAPTPLRGIPEAPKSLSVAERKHWREVAELIDAAGLLSTLDRDALTLYVSLWSRWRHAESRIAPTGGLVVVAHNKVEMPNPWYTIAAKTQIELAKYLDAFGLTPKSRARFAPPESDEADDKWKVFG